MDIVIQAGAGLLILGALVLAYFAGQRWRWTHVVLVMLNFIAFLALFYLSARTVQTHNAWRSAVKRMEADVEGLERQRQQWLEGGEDADGKQILGIKRLRHELAKLSIGRGDVWFNVSPQQVDPASGQCQVSVKSPDPHGINAKTVLHVFGTVNQKQAYLGEFLVAAADAKAKAATLTPNVRLEPAELQQLAAAKGPWTLYSLAPVRTGPRKQVAPGEYTIARDPKELAELLAGKLEMHDFPLLYHHFDSRRRIVRAEMGLAADQIARLKAAQAQFDQSIAYRQAEATKLKGDLERFQAERAAVDKYHGELKQATDAALAKLQETIAATRRAYIELRNRQRSAAEEINRRTEASAAVAQDSARR